MSSQRAKQPSLNYFTRRAKAVIERMPRRDLKDNYDRYFGSSRRFSNSVSQLRKAYLESMVSNFKGLPGDACGHLEYLNHMYSSRQKGPSSRN